MANAALSALVIGGTGSVGKELVRELSSNSNISQVTLITRRKLELDNAKIVVKVVDFEQLSNYRDAFEGNEVAYCCIGTTRGKAGAEGFVRVDKEYVIESAKLLKDAGCSHFHLVTSKGANSNSSLLYLKTKGEVEDLLTDLQFPRLSIYRPSLLICDRDETRPFEKFAQIIAKGFDWKNRFSVSVDTVARAMVANTFNSCSSPAEVLENTDINRMGID